MKIGLGGDHAGFQYKAKLVDHLTALGHEVKDFGPHSADSVDYPDFVHPLSEAVEKGELDYGVLICGSGNGVTVTANKHQGIRAALVWQKELAALSRQHNNSNVICIAARFVAYELAETMVDTFISTPFEGGRHATRVNKISC
ncbi:MAG: ribose 5-phosphate isomerase B [Cyclobacteriaceae bacterium]